MAANSSTSHDNSQSSASAFIIPHPAAFFYAPPPPPPVMVASPFGIYYTFPTYTYYTPQPLPLYTNPRPADQPATAAATSSDLDSQRIRRRGNVPPRQRIPQTTLMINNIPICLRRISVLRFLDRCCEAYPDVEYDFFHLPLDSRTYSNKGFAFVNFTTNDGAKKVMEILNGYKWHGIYDGVFISCRDLCKITWVGEFQQGKEAQIRRFDNFNCDDEEFSPVIFVPPRNGSHPNPTPPFPFRRFI